MSYRAHKDPCGVVGCPQFICMDSQTPLYKQNKSLLSEIAALTLRNSQLEAKVAALESEAKK